jgi:hypothetical protein
MLLIVRSGLKNRFGSRLISNKRKIKLAFNLKKEDQKMTIKNTPSLTSGTGIVGGG